MAVISTYSVDVMNAAAAASVVLKKHAGCGCG